MTEQTQPEQPGLITAGEAAHRLHVTYGCLAVWRCQQRKALPFVRIGRKIFYRPRDIEKFIADNTHPGDGPQSASQHKRSAR